jgi:hypothetical protein
MEFHLYTTTHAKTRGALDETVAHVKTSFAAARVPGKGADLFQHNARLEVQVICLSQEKTEMQEQLIDA